MNFSEIYQPHWRALAEYVNDRPSLSPPLLLACPDRYHQQPTRLFVVGKQTDYWYNNDVRPLKIDGTSIRQLMEIYLGRFRPPALLQQKCYRLG